MESESLCLHAGYTPGNGEPRVLPITQSTTFTYESTEAVARLFDLQDEGFFYSRLGNPTIDAVERKIAALEGGAGALCTASGQSANLLAILNLAHSGDHVISTSSIYGGTFNLFGVTLKKMGVEVSFVDQTAPDADIEKLIRPTTRAIFGETLTNASLDVLDIRRMAALAHRHGLPLIVDNTFATPILCRPFEFGADIVVHSTSKYMDGHAVQLGGVIVDSGSFDWTRGRFPEFTEPDPSYHGLIYTQAFGKAAYIVKARVQLMRDLGCCQTPQGAFYTNLGLETLPLRMRQHCADGADNFLADLFITLLRDDLHDIQQLETRLTDLEQAVLSDETDGFLKQMSAIRKQLHRNNRFYAQLSDFASSLLEEAADLFDRHSTRRWNYFLRKVEHLRDETRLLHEYASQISSEYQAQVDIMQNQVMKLLTIVTTIFLPLSLLAGWYGMNFDGMPELRWAWGYPVLIVAAVVIVLALIRFFKRRKWL